MRTRQPSHPRLRVEPLEDRTAPAVRVFARGSLLYVIGDRAADAVALVREGGEVTVTTANGQTQEFQNISAVFANLGAGNDSLTAMIHPTPVNPNTPTAPPFDLTVDLGEGNDAFTADVMSPPGTDMPVNGLDLGVVAFGQAGKDTLTFRADLPVTFGDLAVRLDGGEGNDTVSTDALIRPAESQQPEPIINLNFTMIGGFGHDRITAKMGIGQEPFMPPMVRAGINVGGGEGNDRIAVQVSGTNPNAQEPAELDELAVAVGGGGGGDEVGIVIINNRVGSLSQTVNLGNGTNSAQLSCTDLVVDGSMRQSVGGGGGGDEVGIIIINNRVGSLSQVVNTGGGNDTLTASYRNLTIQDDMEEPLLGTPVAFLTGDGNDRLVFDAEDVEFRSGFHVNPGAGNDRVRGQFREVGQYESLPISLLDPDGDDDVHLTLQKVTIQEGGFVANTGLGDDRLTMILEEVEHNYHGLPFSVIDPGGNNELSLAMRDVKFNDGGLLVQTAAGNDAVFANLTGVEFGDEAELPTINSGGGHDTVTLTTRQVDLGKRGFVQDSGPGNDRVYLSATDTTADGGAFQVLTGDGNDHFAAAVDQMALSVLGINVNLGNGNDLFQALYVMQLPPMASVPQQFVATMNITVLGGAGDDRIQVQTLVVAPVVDPWFTPPAFAVGARFDLNLLVDGGAGQDILFVQGAYQIPFTTTAGVPRYFGDVDVDALGNTGNDYVTVFWHNPFPFATIQLDALADGGAGIDAANMSPNVAEVNFEF